MTSCIFMASWRMIPLRRKNNKTLELGGKTTTYELFSTDNIYK